MAIELDHFLVPARDKATSARRLAELLGVPSGPAAAGPFFAVYLNEGLTLDFGDAGEELPVHHYCFRVGEEAFDHILGRLQVAGIPYRSSVGGRFDMRINTQYGGRMIYWNEPEGHQWEVLTASYARQPPA
jgi:hypothetical protein